MRSDRMNTPVYIPYAGPTLLATPLLNKGTAFSERERHEFNLTGLLPHRFETIEEQAERSYLQYQSFKADINKHIYLRYLQDTNETLFYYLIEQHLQEMMPIIYTPTVGEACERFSEIYRRARGLFISYPDRYRLDEILHNATKDNVKVIVVTDGSRILGLGDQGIGGMGIPIGKLSLYTACAGISPAYTLPIMLDAGTDNQRLIDDPMYIGWKQPRVNNEEYNEFLECFIRAVEKRWPNVLLQFEDFQQQKALPLLERYQNQICCFNDDIQGTAAVAVGSLLAACRSKQETLSQQTIVFAGAGSAGCGIAEQIIMQMKAEGLSDKGARNKVYMVDRHGLIIDDMGELYDFQQRLAQSAQCRQDWQITSNVINLMDVIEQVQPTILIGVSGQPGLFDEALIKSIMNSCQRPIIFPLSNPSKQIEAHPADLIEWTNGKAIVATGSPFANVAYLGQQVPISQCNNSYIFPGIGLAVVAGGVNRINNSMMMIASNVLAEYSPLAHGTGADLLPPLDDIKTISKKIAFEVAKYAQKHNLAPQKDNADLMQSIDDQFWMPNYRDYRRVSL